jgi:curved DNA-binding protein CbpA
MTDPLADWRSNPFFVLDVSPQASRTEVERAGQKLLGLLALGATGADRYDTPFGPATRDADAVRRALALLRDPNERVIQELWAQVTTGVAPSVATGAATGVESEMDTSAAKAWEEAARAIGWMATWAA